MSAQTRVFIGLDLGQAQEATVNSRGAESLPFQYQGQAKRLRAASTQAPPIDRGASATSDRRLRTAAFGKVPRCP
jgi:hypothetical protein